MKKNKSLLIILIIIAPIAIWFLNQNNNSTLKKQNADFAIADTSLVTKFFIADKNNNKVLLERSKNGWLLDKKYPTNEDGISLFLSTLSKIEIKSPVANAKRDNVIRRLSSIGIKIEIYEKSWRINLGKNFRYFPYEKLTKVYYVGDVTPDNLGTYMLMEGAPEPYITYIPRFRGFLTPYYSAKFDDWLSHQVYRHKLSDIKEVSINFPGKPEENFKVDVAKDGNYFLTGGIDNQPINRYDTLKILNMLTSFSDLRYESRLNNEMSTIMIDSIVNTTPIFEINVIDNSNDTVEVIAYKKNFLSEEVRDEAYWQLIPLDKDRFYGLINDGEDFVLLQYYVFDNVTNPLSHYTE